MTKKKELGGSLTNMRKSTLAGRTIVDVAAHDTTPKTRAWLIERGYIKPGDSQYDKRLDPARNTRRD
jgi:hypothetical protein